MLSAKTFNRILRHRFGKVEGYNPFADREIKKFKVPESKGNWHWSIIISEERNRKR